jgi:hypothetical protein
MRYWHCREKHIFTLGSSEIWELMSNDLPVGYVQLFPNGSTAYWFNACDKGKPGPSYGDRCDHACRALNAAMKIVEDTLREMDRFKSKIEDGYE